MNSTAVEALVEEREWQEKKKADAINACDDHIAKMQSMSSVATQLDRILSEQKYEGNISYCYGTFTIFMLTDGFTSETAPELLSMLEALEELFGEHWIINDEAENRLRRYINTGGITINVTVREDGTCVRALTGTRKRQKLVYIDTDEPIYEFKC